MQNYKIFSFQEINDKIFMIFDENAVDRHVNERNCDRLEGEKFPGRSCHFDIVCKALLGCLICVFKQPFLVFKQHFTHFNTLFHPHVFP